MMTVLHAVPRRVIRQQISFCRGEKEHIVVDARHRTRRHRTSTGARHAKKRASKERSRLPLLHIRSMAGLGLSLTRFVAGCWMSQVTGCHVVALPGLHFMFGVFFPILQDAVQQEISTFPKILRYLAMLPTPPRPNSTSEQLRAYGR